MDSAEQQMQAALVQGLRPAAHAEMINVYQALRNVDHSPYLLPAARKIFETHDLKNMQTFISTLAGFIEQNLPVYMQQNKATALNTVCSLYITAHNEELVNA